MKVFKYLWITYVTQAVCTRLNKDIPKIIREVRKCSQEIDRSFAACDRKNNRTGPLDKIGY